MLDQIRKRLRTWLSVPSPGPDLQVLRDRMDSLETLVMVHLQQPENEADRETVVLTRDIATQPDVHLGAQ
jgi:hypothetical protein